MSTIRILIACLAIAGCGGEQGPPLSVENIEVSTPAPGAQMSAGYLTLKNATSETLVITRVTSPQFARVEMHETTVTDGVSRMRPIDALNVPPGGSVSLERGGKHLMLMGPDEPLGRIELNFHSSDGVVLTATVETN